VYFVLAEKEIRNWMKPQIMFGGNHNGGRRALRWGLENHGLGRAKE
jgi:hypothetical protein